MGKNQELENLLKEAKIKYSLDIKYKSSKYLMEIKTLMLLNIGKILKHVNIL